VAPCEWSAAEARGKGTGERKEKWANGHVSGIGQNDDLEPWDGKEGPMDEGMWISHPHSLRFSSMAPEPAFF